MAMLNPVDASTTNKPHHASKEARAEREAAKLQQPKNEPVVNTPDNWMAYVLEEIAKLKSENELLKDKMVHPAIKWREINNDNKKFSYKMRWGIPVLSYVSKRKDPSKDFVFKNQFWQYDDTNHILVLSLADWTTQEVQITEFNRDFTRSEKMTALDQHWEFITNDSLKLVKTFTFTDLWMTFTLLPNAIN